MVKDVVTWWTTHNTDTQFYVMFPCVFSLQETDNWIVTGLELPGYIVYGWDLGETAILCPGPACQVRRS